MKKHWKQATADQEKVKELQDALGISPILCQLLVQRGIDTYEAAKTFFRPNLDDLPDPFLMKDMNIAVDRLEQALTKGEKVLLYGDYDVDGTTSVALMYHFLSTYVEEIDYYIPDRYKEGYGISSEGVAYAADNGFDLMIAMDCGIKANQQIQEANDRGVDVIICDHHLPEGELPNAVAVLDPKRSDCAYPYKELSGCGVSFKLAQAFSNRNGLPTEALFDLLDLLAISIACDIVPITGENRILAHFGLEQLNKLERPGLKALIHESGKSLPLTISAIVFGIGPMINAAGRIGHAREAVKLLITSNHEDARTDAQFLDKQNKERRALDKSLLEEAVKKVEASDWDETNKTVVLYQPGWHKGVLGIAAAKLTEIYNRPAIVLTQSDSGEAVGSARSVRGYNIYEALKKCGHLMENFGGHAHAAGMSLLPENFPALQKQFEIEVAKTIEERHLQPEIEFSAEIDLKEVNGAFWEILSQFAPFGPHNRNPVFVSRQLKNSGRSRLLKNNHLKLSIQKSEKKIINGIAFGMGDKWDTILEESFDMCYTIEENNWNGNVTLQLNAKDIRGTVIK